MFGEVYRLLERGRSVDRRDVLEEWVGSIIKAAEDFENFKHGR